MITREPVLSAPLGLTYDEDDVLRDLIGPGGAVDDKQVLPAYRNALNTLRIKTGLHYSKCRGIDTSEAVAAVEWIADKARNEGLALRIAWDYNDMSYTFTLGDRTWDWDTLYTLLPRIARELGFDPATGETPEREER